MKKIIFTLFLTLVLIGKALCFPMLTGQVVDQADILSVVAERRISTLLKTERFHQVVVVTVPSLEGMPIEEYANQLGRHWKIGQKGHDNGVLFIIAPNEREVRIEVGYGLEAVLTDTASIKILNEISPALKSGDYDTAAYEAVKKIIPIIQQEKPKTEQPEEKNYGRGFVLAAIIIILFLFFIFSPQKNKALYLDLISLFLSLSPGKDTYKGKGGKFGGGGASKRF